MTTPPNPGQILAQMAVGNWLSQAIYVAAKLSLADLLAAGPRDATDLAAACGARAQPLYRLLRALASVGIFAADESGRFRLTPLAEPLRKDDPASKRAMVLMTGEEQYRAWGELLYSVQTGQTGFDRVFGEPLFDYLSTRPEQARTFDEAMVAIHGRETPAMLAAYDFAGIRILADLGGGNGSVLSAVLLQHPHLRGILFDLPHVVERARPALDAAGLAERCQTVGGSFFETAPAGADAYFLRHILHDWDDERAHRILRIIHAAAPAGAKLLIVESVITPGNEPGFAKLLDLTMLVIPGGQERTADEYRDLLARGGFELRRIIPTAADVSVLEAVKVD
ncbi:MAG: methyltransferase [Pirellulaceae bacterium]|nr:methyltransferase [Pirellulaceae bacterium]